MQTTTDQQKLKNEITVKVKHIEKNKDGESFFCSNWHGWQRKTGIGNKLTCGCEAIRGPTYDCVVKRFKVIIEQNRDFFDKKVWFEDEKEMFKIPVKIGALYYFVPLRYFVELDNLTASDHYQYEKFFEFLKEICFSDKL